MGGVAPSVRGQNLLMKPLTVTREILTLKEETPTFGCQDTMGFCPFSSVFISFEDKSDGKFSVVASLPSAIGKLSGILCFSLQPVI